MNARLSRIFLFVLLAHSLSAFAFQKVLVTGATGFVGRQVVNLLLAKNEPVRVLVRDINKLDPAWVGRVEVVVGDITDEDAVNRAADGVDAIVHTAAYVLDFALDRSVYERVNVGGTKNVVAAAKAESKKRTVRLVHYSSVDVMEYRPNEWVDESTPYALHSPYLYCRSKAKAEKFVLDQYLAESVKRNRQFEVTVVRPTWIFGPGDLTFIPGMITALKAGTPILIGGQSKQLHLSYIENLMDVTWLMLTRPEVVGKAYINDDGPKTWGWLEGSVVAGLGIRPPWPRSIPYYCGLVIGRFMEAKAVLTRSPTRPDLTGYAVQYLFSNQHYKSDRLRDELGYTPRISLDEGMRRTIEHFRPKTTTVPPP